MFEEEQISWPFKVLDEDGNIVFRDALIFANATEFRNTSQSEREVMQQERYDNWQAAIEAGAEDSEES